MEVVPQRCTSVGMGQDTGQGGWLLDRIADQGPGWGRLLSVTPYRGSKGARRFCGFSSKTEAAGWSQCQGVVVGGLRQEVEVGVVLVLL